MTNLIASVSLAFVLTTNIANHVPQHEVPIPVAPDKYGFSPGIYSFRMEDDPDPQYGWSIETVTSNIVASVTVPGQQIFKEFVLRSEDVLSRRVDWTNRVARGYSTNAWLVWTNEFIHAIITNWESWTNQPMRGIYTETPQNNP
jgi:hypothetical protein